jgi:hypothetical protein
VTSRCDARSAADRSTRCTSAGSRRTRARGSPQSDAAPTPVSSRRSRTPIRPPVGPPRAAQLLALRTGGVPRPTSPVQLRPPADRPRRRVPRLTKAFHCAGIEMVLDVVFNHTADRPTISAGSVRVGSANPAIEISRRTLIEQLFGVGGGTCTPDPTRSRDRLVRLGDVGQQLDPSPGRRLHPQLRPRLTMTRPPRPTVAA